MKKRIIRELSECVDEICKKIMDENSITTGNTYPQQEIILEVCCEDIADVLIEIINQNKT